MFGLGYMVVLIFGAIAFVGLAVVAIAHPIVRTATRGSDRDR